MQARIEAINIDLLHHYQLVRSQNSGTTGDMSSRPELEKRLQRNNDFCVNEEGRKISKFKREAL